MARDLKKVQLSLFFTSNIPKMPKGVEDRFLCAHCIPTGQVLYWAVTCCAQSHLCPAKAFASQLRPGSVLALFAQQTSRLCSASSCTLAGLLSCFPYCLLHLIHCLPLPVLCLLPYLTDPKDKTIFLFLPNSESSKHTRNGNLPLHHPGSLCYGHTL